MDPWFPFTGESADFEIFSKLCNWITSKAFGTALSSGRRFVNRLMRRNVDFKAVVKRMEIILDGFSFADWFLKAIWLVLRTRRTTRDLRQSINKYLEGIGSGQLKDRDNVFFKSHVSATRDLITFFEKIELLHNSSRGKFKDNANTFFNKVRQNCTTKVSACPPAHLFFRSSAHSCIFENAPLPRQSNASKWARRCRSPHESTLGRSLLLSIMSLFSGRLIFGPYFGGVCNASEAYSPQNTVPFSGDYLMVRSKTGHT